MLFDEEPILVESTVASTTTSDPTTQASTQALSPPDAFTLWKRRLITHEDPFSLHKFACVVYSLSGVFILGVGGLAFCSTFSTQHTEFAVIPAYLEWPSYIFVVSNSIMCAASVRMSFLHRQFDLVARNAFLGTAVSSLFSGYYFLWTSPFAPPAFNIPLVNQSCFGVLVLLNVCFIMDTVLQVPAVVEGRRDKKAEKAAQATAATAALQDAALGDSVTQGGDALESTVPENSFVLDALVYVLPIAWGLLPVLSTGYISSIMHDRPWFIDQCAYIDSVTGLHGLRSNVSYLQVLTSLAASYGSLFVTLRDKKLISRNAEIAGISVFSISAMVWTAYVTVVFGSHLFDIHP